VPQARATPRRAGRPVAGRPRTGPTPQVRFPPAWSAPETRPTLRRPATPGARGPWRSGACGWPPPAARCGTVQPRRREPIGYCCVLCLGGRETDLAVVGARWTRL
jgi:hypothetical protein